MTHSTKTLALAFIAAVMIAMPCMAQEVAPPFTWEGKGAASFIGEGGTEEIDFQFELSVDEQGMVDGKTSAESGISKIKHVFYSETKQYDIPGFFARRIVIVLMSDEYGNNPMLIVLNGRLLADRFLYGEVMATSYEAGSETARALGIGDSEATLMAGDELPNSLRSVLKKCLPVGIVKIEGGYKKEETIASPSSDSITLFNGRDLNGWHTYLKDSDADPKSVWKVRDGELWCTGKPTGFLRTNREYGDFKLTLQWRWPEKPGNSGVLLRMSGEEKIWPLCMEAQLMHTRAGDFVGMGCDFNENKAPKGGPVSYTPRLNGSSEKEIGGWNTYEITCNGETIHATINGQPQNKATGVNISKGYIGLQSEGVPIVFRNIKLTPLR